MSDFDREAFIRALCDMQPGMPEQLVANMADMYLQDMDPRLYPALTSWINREPVENVTWGEFSLEKIMMIRGNDNYLDAMVLLSAYMQDEKKGRARILTPRK